MDNLKERFVEETANLQGKSVLMTVVQLPTGAKEVITNTDNLQSKVDYLKNTYDEEFKLRANPNVRIIAYLIA